MANANKPFGLRPVKSLTASDWDGRGNVYSIPTSDATNTYRIGDVVRLNGSGDTLGIPGIVKSVAGDGGILGQGAVGVIVAVGTVPQGPYINPRDLETLTVPVAKLQTYYALVADDSNLIFEVQEINSGTALTAAAIGLNANLSITANQTSGVLSSTVLDNATEAVTIGLDVKILGLTRVADNAFGLAAKWLVLINSHAYRAAITGI